MPSEMASTTPAPPRGDNEPVKIAINAIAVGDRDREELGDIEALAASIAAVGLLHPVVVTADHALVAGDRRLAAVKRLGWAEVPVTVVDLTTAAEVLRAEADENTCRKGLTLYEAAQARKRRATVLAEDAAKRVGGRPRKGEEKTGSKLEPVSQNLSKTRKLAAIGTGYSGSTLDKVDRITDIAEHGVIKRGKEEIPAPAPVRAVAEQAVADIKQTGAAMDRSSKNVEAAVTEFLGADPNLQRSMFRKQVSDAVKAVSHGLPMIDVDRMALEAGRDAALWDRVMAARDMLDAWVTEVDRARPTGLRLVEGGRS